jgi:hypothetical protein
MSISFYNKILGRPYCGLNNYEFNNFNKITKCNKSFYDKKITEQNVCDINKLGLDDFNKISDCDKSFYNIKIDRRECGIHKVDFNYFNDINKITACNKSFYDKKLGRQECGVDNIDLDICGKITKCDKLFYDKKLSQLECIDTCRKITIVNIVTDDIDEYLMKCDESFYPLKTTINPKTGELVEIVCRRELGDIESDCGLYIITMWKRP